MHDYSVLFDWHSIGVWLPRLCAPALPALICAGIMSVPLGQKLFARIVVSILVVGWCALFWGFLGWTWSQELFGRAATVEGTVTGYHASDAGKDVHFAVNGREFDVSCCNIAPYYSGTPTDGGRQVIANGMRVRVTTVASWYTDGIIRLEELR